METPSDTDSDTDAKVSDTKVTILVRMASAVGITDTPHKDADSVRVWADLGEYAEPKACGILHVCAKVVDADTGMDIDVQRLRAEHRELRECLLLIAHARDGRLGRQLNELLTAEEAMRVLQALHTACEAVEP